MKTLLPKLSRYRLAQAAGLLAIIAALAVSMAWSRPPQAQYQLGGAWIGSGGGFIWNAFHIPLDPAGMTAALRVGSMTYGADFAGLLAMFGADTVTEETAQAQMISRDTAKYAFVGYGVKQGNPPLICLITVMTGTLRFTGPESMVVNYSIDVYPGPANTLGLPNADDDADGFPDPGTTPMLSIPGTGSAKRVTVP